MFSKIICIAALVGAVYGQADRYPAGVNPNLCPNYPLCDNAALAYNTAPSAPAHPQFNYNPNPNPAPQFNYNPNPAPQFNYNPIPAPPPAPAPLPQYTQSAAQYPAGVSAASCPNYPFCSNSGAAVAAPPLPGFSARLYPDGLNPANCPNYPYCN